MTTALHVPPPGAARAGPASARGSVTGWLAVGVAGLGVGLLVARRHGLTPPACLLREHVGLPCPACGLTRLADALAHGRVTPAVAADPFGVVLLLAVAAVALGQVVAWRGRPIVALRGRALPLVLAGLLVAHWAATLLGGGLPG